MSGYRTQDHLKELTGNGRARKYVAVQELDETLDGYKHTEEVIRIWLPDVAVRIRILRSPVLRYESL